MQSQLRNAGSGSQPGRYAIDGSGLTAMNYVLVEAAGNATALTLKAGNAAGPSSALLLQAQIAAGTLEAELPASETIIQLEPIYLAQSLGLAQNPDPAMGDVFSDPTLNEPVRDDRVASDGRVPSLRVVRGGVKLPDDRVDVNAQ